ncbi:MAG TPA: hypothetical protein PKM43_05490 [Verrucomicrobiota bacterium]|nr:hypothetical protein [Verrucomicrobiota bacterium]HRZ36603.1 hypothetical protein [Candidatus Paceibacterota bacterium]HRZ56289.1 hypothetical protein [Candidatus Paceibacterota bacterium]
MRASKLLELRTPGHDAVLMRLHHLLNLREHVGLVLGDIALLRRIAAVKRNPSAAIRSRCGVRMAGAP